MRAAHQLGLGALMIVPSGALILYISAWSTLAGGEFPEGGRERWQAVLGTMSRPGDPGTVTYVDCAGFALGAIICISGGWSIIRRELRTP
jgi:hypothetical protein